MQTISGYELLERLTDQRTDIATEQKRIIDLRTRQTSKFRSLRQESLQVSSAMALAWLKRLDRNEIKPPLSEVERECQSLLLAKAVQRQLYESELSSITVDVERQRHELARLKSIDKEFGERIAELSEQLERRIAEDAHSSSVKAAYDIERQAYELAVQKQAAVEEESKQKRKAYEDDALFRYLWNVGFGSESYRGRGITARCDRAVAHMSKYQENAANYRILLDMPGYFAQLVASVVEQSRVINDKWNGVLLHNKEVLGLDRAESDQTLVREQIQSATAVLSEIESVRTKAKSNIDVFDAYQDEYSRDAQTRLSSYFLSHSILDVKYECLHEFSEQLVNLRLASDEVERNVDDYSRALRNVTERLESIGRLIEMLGHKGFSDDSVNFARLDIEHLISLEPIEALAMLSACLTKEGASNYVSDPSDRSLELSEAIWRTSSSKEEETPHRYVSGGTAETSEYETGGQV